MRPNGISGCQDDYDRRRALSSPSRKTRLYVFIHIAAARASSADKPEVANQILRDLLVKEPNDLQVRLALAEQLAAVPPQDPAGDPKVQQAAINKARQEAIDVLDRPFTASAVTGPRAFLTREWQVRA